MEIIRFRTVVTQEQVIRPPKDIVLPKGTIEVIVRVADESETTEPDSLAETRSWLLAFAEEAEQAAPELPSDMAEHHDHYAHGKPLS